MNFAMKQGWVPALWGSIAVAAALALSACGGGGGGGGGGPTPDEVMDTLSDKVNVPGATVSQPSGDPPAAADNPAGSEGSEPVVSADDGEIDGEPGEKVTIPVSVQVTNALDSLFAKIPGASSYFQAQIDPAGAKLASAIPTKMGFTVKPRAMAKGTLILDFEVDLPEGTPTGRKICFEFSAQDVETLTSDVTKVCIVVVSPAPTPTATPAPTPTPTPTPPPTTGTAADCLNEDIFTAGNRYTLNTRSTFSGETYESNSEYVALGQTTFNGNQALEVAVSFSESSGGEVFSSESAKEYLSLSGTTLTFYGSTFEDTVDGVTYSGETTFEPGAEFRFGLDVGESYSQTYAVNSTSTVDGQTFEFSSTETDQTTYVGQEQITVPAGTFDTCHFTETYSIDGETGTYDYWISVGSGVSIKSVYDDGEEEVLLGATINGSPVTGN